jgi:HAD superfamily hydrolase (TIGR01509 family)
MANEPKAAALVDLDGTLVDSNYHHAIAWWRAFRDAGRQVPIARLHKLIGMGSDQLLGTVIGGQDPELERASGEQFREIRGEVVAFAGAANFLRALAERGFVVVLATSGREDDVKHMRSLLDADEWITAEVNSSEIDKTKPAPDIFEVALERSGVAASHAVVVGDTGWDVEAAARCGLPCVAVTTGGWSRRDLESCGAREVYEGVDDLVNHIDGGVLGELSRSARPRTPTARRLRPR